MHKHHISYSENCADFKDDCDYFYSDPMGDDVLRSGHQEIFKCVLNQLEGSHADPKMQL